MGVYRMQRRKEWTDEELERWLHGLIAASNIHAFYICKPWIHLCAEVRREQNGECQLCRKKGIYSPAEVVHHVKPLKRYPRLALTKANLLCLCGACHYAVHHPAGEPTTAERW